MNLQTPLRAVLKTTKDHLAALESLRLHTVENFLLYLPRSHEDLSCTVTIAQAALEQKVTVRGIISDLKLVRTRNGKRLVTAQLHDSEGDMLELIWFNQPHILRMLKEGDELALTGKIVENGYKVQMQSPQFELAGAKTSLVHSGRLVPVYPQHDIITTKWIREKMDLVKDAIALLPETLPPDIIAEEKLCSRSDAIWSLHFPRSGADVERAQARLAFEEMYTMQIDALQRKKEWQGNAQERLKTPMDVELIRQFFASLKFTPTDSQKIAIYEILRDMEKPIPMSRLLEGDVGSGKTLVATAVIANVLRHGGQCAFMVPTEVLARQHAQSIAKMLINFRAAGCLPSIALLTGSLPAAQAHETRRKTAEGRIDLLIGTHALIEDLVRFRDLRLVVVDEQHRFGVAQRERLVEKGNPHFLSMTATPIPRTLALTAFGHHDLSVLTEKPGNRKPIETRVIGPAQRVSIERFIDQQIDEGRQCFVICPLIGQSDADELTDVRNAEGEAKRLREAFPRRRVALLHGKMASAEKERVMQEFRDRKADILVSTAVIEVGIDIPNSSIILIEGAERFGLAQLHQFRGRVGRAEHKSYCFLAATTPRQAASPRLKAMEQHASGFVLAEIDLKLRGPGELFGLRQSGIPEARLQGLLHPEVVVRARRAAEKFLGIHVVPVAV